MTDSSGARTCLSHSSVEDAIARCVRYYREQKHPGLWMVWPSDQPSVGLIDGEPVAASSVVYGAGVACVYNVTTLSDYRGRGIGTAMTLAPQYDALARGYQLAVLQASEMGESIYARMGYRWPPPVVRAAAAGL